MTGIYLRVERDGDYISTAIEDMTPDELQEALQGWVSEALLRVLQIALQDLRHHKSMYEIQALKASVLESQIKLLGETGHQTKG